MKRVFNLFISTFPSLNFITFISTVENNLRDCESILDVGCGENSPLQYFQGNYKTMGIDGYKKAVDKSKKRGIHDEYAVYDIQSMSQKIKPKSFDAVIALDVIEHLKKEDGYKLLKNMERVARKKVILVTPNGFIPQHNKHNKLQVHLSGWTVEDFKNRGYYVEGVYGTILCNALRTEEAELRWKPWIFWAIVWGILVEITHHLYTKKNPKYSIGLLAVKKIK